MMKNLPVVLDGYQLMITEAPMMQMFKDKKTGEEKPALIFGTERPKYVVSLFAKPPKNAEGYRPKGEEIKVTLLTDPGSQFSEGEYVSLRGLTASVRTIPHKNASKDTGTQDAIGYVGWDFVAEGLSPASPHLAATAA